MSDVVSESLYHSLLASDDVDAVVDSFLDARALDVDDTCSVQRMPVMACDEVRVRVRRLRPPTPEIVQEVTAHSPPQEGNESYSYSYSYSYSSDSSSTSTSTVSRLRDEPKPRISYKPVGRRPVEHRVVLLSDAQPNQRVVEQRVGRVKNTVAQQRTSAREVNDEQFRKMLLTPAPLVQSPSTSCGLQVIGQAPAGIEASGKAGAHSVDAPQPTLPLPPPKAKARCFC